MKKAVFFLVATSVLYGSSFTDGVFGAVSEKKIIKYIKLRNFCVVADGKNISSVNLLKIKEIAKKQLIPNVKFINNRFLLFGDYEREADARGIYNMLQKSFKDKLVLRIAKSSVFGDRVVLTPILVSAYRDGESLHNKEAILESGMLYEDRGVDDDSIGFERFYPQRTNVHGVVERNYYYDNSGWDSAVDSHKEDTVDSLDYLKKSNIHREYIVVNGKKVYINESFNGYKLIDINLPDKSFLVRNIENGDTFLITSNEIIKM